MRTLAEKYRQNAERMQAAAQIVEAVLDDLPNERGLTALTAAIHRTLNLQVEALHRAEADLADASEETPRG